MCAPAGVAAKSDLGKLRDRQHRQIDTLHRDRGTVRFFHNHRPQARTVIGRRAVRFARARIRWTLRELAETRFALHPKPTSVPAIICAVFGADCGTALSVAMCESRYSVYARNGQYFGVFQMGAGERARFGGSSVDPWDQVKAAYRYFRVAGWGPWACA